jgi:hypothetical protein
VVPIAIFARHHFNQLRKRRPGVRVGEQPADFLQLIEQRLVSREPDLRVFGVQRRDSIFRQVVSARIACGDVSLGASAALA